MAAIVLQNEKLARLASQKIDTGDVRENAMPWTGADELSAKVAARQHQVKWDDPFTKAPLIAVHILKKEVDGGHTLDQPRLKQLPFVRANDARNKVEGEDPLGPLILAIHRKGDSLVNQRYLLKFFAATDLILIEATKS